MKKKVNESRYTVSIGKYDENPVYPVSGSIGSSNYKNFSVDSGDVYDVQRMLQLAGIFPEAEANQISQETMPEIDFSPCGVSNQQKNLPQIMANYRDTMEDMLYANSLGDKDEGHIAGQTGDFSDRRNVQKKKDTSPKFGDNSLDDPTDEEEDLDEWFSASGPFLNVKKVRGKWSIVDASDPSNERIVKGGLSSEKEARFALYKMMKKESINEDDGVTFKSMMEDYYKFEEKESTNEEDLRIEEIIHTKIDSIAPIDFPDIDIEEVRRAARYALKNWMKSPTQIKRVSDKLIGNMVSDINVSWGIASGIADQLKTWFNTKYMLGFRTSDDSRMDRLLRTRDSSGKATARKFR